MTQPLQKCLNTTSETMFHMAAAAGVGYLCSRVVLVVDPVAGGVFCALNALVSKFVNPLFDLFFQRKGTSEATQTVGSFLSTACGIASAVALTQFAGLSLSYSAGFLLICSIVAIKIITTIGMALAMAHLAG